MKEIKSIFESGALIERNSRWQLCCSDNSICLDRKTIERIKKITLNVRTRPTDRDTTDGEGKQRKWTIMFDIEAFSPPARRRPNKRNDFSDLSFPSLCAVIESTELRPRKLIRFRSTLRLYTSNPAYLLRRGFRLRHSISRSAFITPPAHIHSSAFFMSWQNWFMFKKIVWIATQAI